jgi:hypothetical protein
MWFGRVKELLESGHYDNAVRERTRELTPRVYVTRA